MPVAAEADWLPSVRSQPIGHQPPRKLVGKRFQFPERETAGAIDNSNSVCLLVGLQPQPTQHCLVTSWLAASKFTLPTQHAGDWIGL
jgi:hypothetical protein